MDDQDFERDMQAQWYYGQWGRPNGPVSWQELNDKLRSKEVSLTVIVWREGTRKWTPVTKVPALLQGVPEPPGGFAAITFSFPPEMVRKARHNAIAMFILLQLWVMGLLGHVLIAAFSHRITDPCCIQGTGMLGGIYAAVYLPLQWRVLLQLPRTLSLLGFIGGIGLIVLMLLTIADLAVYRMLGFSLLVFFRSLVSSPLAY